jgi:hypothetical protein
VGGAPNTAAEEAVNLSDPGSGEAVPAGHGDNGIGVMVDRSGDGAGFRALRNPITRTSIRGMKRWPYSEKRPPY